MSTVQHVLQKLRELPFTKPLRVLNVCGGHERTISHGGLRTVLEDKIDLIPGPGCPVCVCPEEDIFLAIQIALQKNVIVAAFGDMLRVPANTTKIRSLTEARAAGAGVVPIASPQEVVRLARDNPHKDIVFFAAGFETTMAPVAACIKEGIPHNLSILLSGRRTWPIVDSLLKTGPIGFDALIAPGHVATIMGAEEWSFVPENYGLPTAISGFQPEELIFALGDLAHQTLSHEVKLSNCYPTVVSPKGSMAAQNLLSEVFEITESNWRGIGAIDHSGYQLRGSYKALDARTKFQDLADPKRRYKGQMPRGCSCSKVVLGLKKPLECALYGKNCTPQSPIGPCMVSDEGACAIWWAAGMRKERKSVGMSL